MTLKAVDNNDLFKHIVEKAEDQIQAEKKVDTAAVALKAAADALNRAALDQDNRDKILKEAEEALGKVSLADFPKLADSPVVKAITQLLGISDLKPGEVRNRGSIVEREREWTWKDVSELELVRFTPVETVQITFNDLVLQLVSEQECQVPRPFYDIYMERRKALRQARINEDYLMGKSDIPPDLMWQCPEGAEVRMHSIQGRSLGRPSGHVGFGPISDLEGI